MSVYTLENEAFAALVKYGSIVLLKMVAMSPITGFSRIGKGAFATEEDARAQARGDKEKAKKLMAPNQDVERMRMAHRNDLENIVPFMFIALLYLSTKPDAATAIMLFKVFTAARIAHTIVYLGKVRQPARVLAFLGGISINVYMLFATLRAVW